MPTWKFFRSKTSSTEKVYRQAWLKWSSLNRCVKNVLLRTHYLPLLMRLALHYVADLWRTKRLESGLAEKTISSVFKMSAWIYYKVLWSNVRRTTKRSMRIELKKSDSKRRKLKSVHLPRFRENVLRCSEKCIKPAKMLRSRVPEEI